MIKIFSQIRITNLYKPHRAFFTMFKTSKLITAILLLLCSTLGFANTDAKNVLYAVSKGYDFIGQTQTYNLSDNDGKFNTRPLLYQPLSQGIEVQFMPGGDRFLKWSLEFVAPNNQSFIIGKTYEDAQRLPNHEAGKPGMSISALGRGCNTLVGKFTVLEFNRNKNGNVESLAIDFQQICDDRGVLVGSVRYHSTIPVNILPKNKLRIEIKSEQGEYIGNGKEYHLTSDKYNLINDFLFNHNNSIVILDIDDFNLHFAPPINEEWHVGKYDMAVDYPFGPINNPSLKIEGPGRSCQAFGKFEILEIDYDKKYRTINKLALNFEQQCVRLSPVLRGAIRYNSDIPF